MENSCSVPPPINFNCWKHHAGFIIRQTETINNEKELTDLKKILLKIGESQMDLYLGSITPEEITRNIINKLIKIKAAGYKEYKNWLNEEGKDFRLVKLKDDSDWTIRLGEEKERYVHIHPARNSKNTIRVKAHTLKTVILLNAWGKINRTENFDKELINMLRNRFLDLPPLKPSKENPGIGKLIKLFDQSIKGGEKQILL